MGADSKESTGWDEPWGFYATDESLTSTPETNTGMELNFKITINSLGDSKEQPRLGITAYSCV